MDRADLWRTLWRGESGGHRCFLAGREDQHSLRKPSAMSSTLSVMFTRCWRTFKFSNLCNYKAHLDNYKNVDRGEGLAWSSVQSGLYLERAHFSSECLRSPCKRHNEQFLRRVSLVEDEGTQTFPFEGEEPDEVMPNVMFQKGYIDPSFMAYDLEFIKRISMLPLNDKVDIVPVIKAWIAEGKVLTKEGLVAAMTKLRRWTRYKQALQISEWMAKEEPFELDEMDAINRFHLIAKSGDLAGAENLFKELPPHFKTERAYNTLLSVYCNRNLVTKAEKLMDDLKESRLCSLPFAYNQMMSLYIRQGSLDKLSFLLEELKSTGITPDVFTYNILMGYMGKSGDIEAMEKLMDELKADSHVSPNGVTYAILANAYILGGLKDKAEKVLKEKEAALNAGLIKRRLRCYETLITMYGTLGNLDGVERVWRGVKHFPQKTNAAYVCMIEALGRMGEIEKAEKIFEQRKKENKFITIRLYNALLCGYSRQGLMRKAEGLMQEMRNRGLTLDSLSYYHLIRGHLFNNEDEKALDAFKKVKSIPGLGRPKLWYETSLSILKVFSERGDVSNAEIHFRDCRKEYINKDVRLYNLLLKAYVKAQMPIHRFLDRVTADHIQPNEETKDLLKQLEHYMCISSLQDESNKEIMDKQVS